MKHPAATAVPITPATFGPIACMSRKFVGSSSAPTFWDTRAAIGTADTRMTTEQMLPIIPKMDKVGFNAVECWGGATFDACLRFLKEDPWDRLRKLRDGFKNTLLLKYR